MTPSRYATSTKALMGRAVDIAVIALLSYFGFLADVKESIRTTQEDVAVVKRAQFACSADIESLRRDLDAHQKTEEAKK